jgi:hypothetical protein
MDERLRICLWMVGGGIFGGVLGGIFGALAAALYARNGGAAGTRLARNVVENVLQTGERQASSTVHAALIGAADGFFFIGIFGLIAGALLGIVVRNADDSLVPVISGSLLLFGGAILFGTAAYALTYHTAEFLYSLTGGLLGCLLASLLEPLLVLPGLVTGLYLGLYVCRTVRRYSPKFHPPRIEEIPSQPCSPADTDITGSSPSLPDNEFFHKPDSFREH